RGAALTGRRRCSTRPRASTSGPSAASGSEAPPVRLWEPPGHAATRRRRPADCGRRPVVHGRHRPLEGRQAPAVRPDAGPAADGEVSAAGELQGEWEVVGSVIDYYDLGTLTSVQATEREGRPEYFRVVIDRFLQPTAAATARRRGGRRGRQTAVLVAGEL